MRKNLNISKASKVNNKLEEWYMKRRSKKENKEVTSIGLEKEVTLGWSGRAL